MGDVLRGYLGYFKLTHMTFRDGTDYSSQGPVGAEFARTAQSLDMW